MVKVNVCPTTDTSWGVADEYILYFSEKKGVYKDYASSQDVANMENNKEIEIVNGKKYCFWK